MTYKELKEEFYGVEVEAHKLDITLSIKMLKCKIKPQYLIPIEIHICGNKAFLTF